jgi:hypothetical protein
MWKDGGLAQPMVLPARLLPTGVQMAPTKTHKRTQRAATVCSKDGKWIYYLDAADMRYLRCIPVDVGSPETVGYPHGGSASSKTVASLPAPKVLPVPKIKTVSLADRSR